MPEIVGFVGSSHVDRNVNFDAQRCVNMFPEVSASGTSKSPAKLVSAPGLSVWCDFRALVNRGVRGMLKFNEDALFVVAGDKVLRINVGGMATVIGTIASSNRPVSMATNGIGVVFVTGPKGYSINVNTDTVTEIADPSFQGADAVFFLAGSYVFNKRDTSQFQATDPYSINLQPLWFATAEGSPDSLVTLAINLQEVWLFGTETLEVWVNDGGAGFPYSRVPGVSIEQGCAAKYSVAQLDGSLIWLSANEDGQGQIFQTQGFRPVRISSHSIEAAIAGYSVISDAIAYAYQQEGHSFYVITFPSENVTWAYDTTTSTWHQRGYLLDNGAFGRHRSNCHTFFTRSNMVGDWEIGIIYRMTTSAYTDNGNPLVRLRTSPHIASGFSKIAHASLQIDIQTGVGLNVGQGSDPKIKLRWSDDGGHIFAGTRTESIGKMGEYRKRVRFLRLGQSRDRVYEISCADPIPFTILSAHYNANQ